MLALAEILRDEAEVLDALVDRCSTGATEIELVGAARAARRRCARLVVQRLADEARRRAGPRGGAAPAADDRWRSARTGRRIARSARTACGRRRTDGVLRFGAHAAIARDP